MPASWLDPRLEVRPSPIDGHGIFATAPIEKGKTIIIWGGQVFTREDIAAGRALRRSYTAISEDLFLGNVAGQEHTADDYINHACDPAVWMLDEVTLATRRRLAVGDEVTIDYAMYLDADWEPEACRCGSRLCRGSITSEDWQKPELFERYGYHFSPFLNERIRKLRA
ncbi:SET domain-containing protein [Polyangium jinanense]|uniref:SET domain-containing protein n=1 Tax=Polyangium jinanense TaxID=2829994 RepID=UPI002341CEC2|nr:SET domain-containing protein-lysine N-methyltransferase [Polyangium jinanense]MDC3958863.1 SET domain-containing protein-lysine N-methyltransferase [Polyangium jinanense]